MIVDGIQVKTIPGFPDYAITRNGRVWSKPRQRLFSVNNPKKFRFYRGRWLYLRYSLDGYLKITLCKNNKKYFYRVHRLVLETYIGPCPVGMECRHLNGKRDDNSLENLQWGTQEENQLDRNKHETGAQGVKHGMVKLTEDKVRVIRYLRKVAKFTLTDLAWQFDVHIVTICNICKRKTWKHI